MTFRCTDYNNYTKKRLFLGVGVQRMCVCVSSGRREVWHGQAGGKGEGDASCLFLFDVTLISSSLSFFFFFVGHPGARKENTKF